MSSRVLVLRAPGTNCDAETAHAFQLAGAAPTVLHLNRWLEAPDKLNDYDILCLPGGFSFGDDVAAGRIFANQLQHHLSEALAKFRDAGKLILGICNGFQVLIKSGLLDNASDFGSEQPALGSTLAWNTSGRYLARWVRLEADSSKCVFLKGIEQIYLPIAHAEGRFMVRDKAELARLEAAGQLALRYEASDNPNGAMGHIAGMCDVTGRVFGLMPHPERFVDRTQHPQWTRRPEVTEGAGLAIFRNAVEYCQAFA